jgi:hypothetical protein
MVTTRKNDSGVLSLDLTKAFPVIFTTRDMDVATFIVLVYDHASSLYETCDTWFACLRRA